MKPTSVTSTVILGGVGRHLTFTDPRIRADGSRTPIVTVNIRLRPLRPWQLKPRSTHGHPLLSLLLYNGRIVGRILRQLARTHSRLPFLDKPTRLLQIAIQDQVRFDLCAV